MMVICPTYSSPKLGVNFWSYQNLENENDWGGDQVRYDDVSHPFFATSSSLAIQAQSAGLLSAFRDQVRKTWQRVG